LLPMHPRAIFNDKSGMIAFSAGAIALTLYHKDGCVAKLDNFRCPESPLCHPIRVITSSRLDDTIVPAEMRANLPSEKRRET
ncbi:MAG: hypothetical protein JXA93_11570, partial [Anaerolineae bacterium]|nr:hypothetical protein [Anaerolineae bacterium]